MTTASNPNRHHFDTLLSEGIITQDEYERALRLAPREALPAPANALVWMAMEKAIGEQRYLGIFDELDEEEGRQAADPARARRIDILEQAEALQLHVVAEGLAAEERDKAARPSLLPGPRWAWNGLFVLAAAGIGWLVFGPSGVPRCTASSVARSVNNMFLMAGIDQAVANPLASLGRERSTPILGKVHEVGYAKQEQVRGCTAIVKAGDSAFPYAFTIARNRDGKDGDEFAITGANPVIVETRFTNLDGDGRHVHDAAPIGRPALERAFRAGADAMQAKRAVWAPGMYAMEEEKKKEQQKGLSTRAADRLRHIPEIEPVAPCRELKAGSTYRCRLLVERNDPAAALFAMLPGHAGSTVLDGEFTFERDGAAGPWRVSPAFDDEFNQAHLAARTAAVKAALDARQP